MHKHRFHHALDIISHRRVGEPQGQEAFLRQNSVPHPILSCSIIVTVRRAIHFDNKPTVEADEIKDISPQRRLPPKMETFRP